MHVNLEVIHHPALGIPRPCPPLLFVHGAFSSARCWEVNFIPWLTARGFDCWAFSFRGHGKSSGRDFLSLASLDHYRYDLAQTVAELPAPPILIGHGMGGLVIQQWLHHGTAPAVAMLASVPPVSGGCSMLQLAMTNPCALLLALNGLNQASPEATVIQQLRETMFSSGTPDDLIRANLDCFQPESHRALIDLSVLSFEPIPAERRPPLLMLAGEEDQLLPHHLVHAAAAHCGINGKTLPHIGHALMLDTQWESVVKSLFDWLENISSQ